jgi:hypothetical protein
MKDLIIKGHDNIRSKLDFISVSSTLYLHNDLVAFLKIRNIVSARGLISFLIATPDSFVRFNIMTETERDSFKDDLFGLLPELLPPEVPPGTPPKKYAYGALRPDMKKPDGKSN